MFNLATAIFLKVFTGEDTLYSKKSLAQEQPCVTSKFPIASNIIFARAAEVSLFHCPRRRNWSLHGCVFRQLLTIDSKGRLLKFNKASRKVSITY